MWPTLKGSVFSPTLRGQYQHKLFGMLQTGWSFLPHLLSSIIYFYQDQLEDIHFILWVIIENYHFYSAAQSLPSVPSQTPSVGIGVVFQHLLTAGTARCPRFILRISHQP